MAFNGTLISVGNYTIPLKFIKAESYSAYLNVQDLDSFRDANGLLHRTTLEHVPVKIEIETMPLNSNDFESLMNGIKNNYSIAIERKANVVAYVPENNNYITQELYLAQPQPKIDTIDTDNNIVYFKPMKLTFIGY